MEPERPFQQSGIPSCMPTLHAPSQRSSNLLLLASPCPRLRDSRPPPAASSLAQPNPGPSLAPAATACCRLCCRFLAAIPRTPLLPVCRPHPVPALALAHSPPPPNHPSNHPSKYPSSSCRTGIDYRHYLQYNHQPPPVQCAVPPTVRLGLYCMYGPEPGRRRRAPAAWRRRKDAWAASSARRHCECRAVWSRASASAVRLGSSSRQWARQRGQGAVGSGRGEQGSIGYEGGDVA